MLPETTATMGKPVLKMKPKPGYTINLMRTKAKMMFTIHDATLSSSQMKCQTFFQVSLSDFSILLLENGDNKKVSFLGLCIATVKAYAGASAG